jgi:hypothetical protein
MYESVNPYESPSCYPIHCDHHPGRRSDLGKIHTFTHSHASARFGVHAEHTAARALADRAITPPLAFPQLGPSFPQFSKPMDLNDLGVTGVNV